MSSLSDCTLCLFLLYYSELFILVLNLRKSFQAADADNSQSISAKELATVIHQLKLKATPQSIGMGVSIHPPTKHSTDNSA